jgi:hypothetical protein
MSHIPDIGAYHHDTVELVAGKEVQFSNELLRDSGKRFIEEAVELAMATGLSPQEVLVHVTDAIYNETRKEQQLRGKLIYPSEMPVRRESASNIMVEISDVRICADYIRHICSIPKDTQAAHMQTKAELVRERAKQGALVMVGNRVYKKQART